MYITENIGPLELVSELLCAEAVEEHVTSNFGKYQHNNDLCPGFRDRIIRVLSTYKKHRIDVHDVQGFQDKGVDVALQIKTDSGTVRVGLQIKSEKEIVNWKSGRAPQFIANIRNQYTQARQEALVEQLYLVLCADVIKHRDHLRTITTSFVNYDGLKIVMPDQAYGFFSMSETELDVAVTRRLCSRDFILREARRSLTVLPAGGPSVALYLIFSALSGQTTISHDDLSKLLFDAAKEAGSEIPELLLQAFNGGLVEDRSVYEEYHIVPDAFPAICALYFDQYARYSDKIGAKKRTELLLLED